MDIISKCAYREQFTKYTMLKSNYHLRISNKKRIAPIKFLCDSCPKMKIPFISFFYCSINKFSEKLNVNIAKLFTMQKFKKICGRYVVEKKFIVMNVAYTIEIPSSLHFIQLSAFAHSQ